MRVLPSNCFGILPCLINFWPLNCKPIYHFFVFCPTSLYFNAVTVQSTFIQECVYDFMPNCLFLQSFAVCSSFMLISSICGHVTIYNLLFHKIAVSADRSSFKLLVFIVFLTHNRILNAQNINCHTLCTVGPVIDLVLSGLGVSPACSQNRLYSALSAADFFRACVAPSLSPVAIMASLSSFA